MSNPLGPLQVDESLANTLEPFAIVAIGASAGGLAPLEEFFSSVGEMEDAAFIVIQHLPQDHKSMMKQLLTRRCNMPVEEATDNMQVEPGRVYLMPPGMLMTIEANHLYVKNKVKNEALGYPIDHFLHSLAQERKDRAIAMILSGTGSDGAQGIRSIKEMEGLVLVQKPESSQFDGMPRNAISTGMVDLTLPPVQMITEIRQFANRAGRTRFTMNEREVSVESIINIIHLLKEKKGVDFTRYKQEFVLRRIHRSMSLQHAENLNAYYYFLLENEPAQENLFQELMVGITQFFRDPEAFESLKEHVFPSLIQRSETDVLRVWVPGCATGEEAYSLAIILQEYMEAHNKAIPVKIFATDANEKAISFASAARFPESAARDIPPLLLAKYFTKKAEMYEVNRKIREMIVFTRHNVIEDVPFNRLDLISCRNVLIYFQPQIQNQIIAAFNFALKQDHYLWLGTSETADSFKEIFPPVVSKWRIYRSSFSIGTGKKLGLPSILMPRRQVSATPARNGQLTMRSRLLEAASEIMIKEMGAAGMLINAQMELMRYFGNAGRYLTIPQEPGDWNLLKMVEPEIAAILSAGVRRAQQDKARMSFKGIRFGNLKPNNSHNIVVVPHVHDSLGGMLFMVIIREEVESSDISGDDSTVLDKTLSARINHLEHELRLNQENLQSTIEELQTSNEELMTANEELQGTNEELQSVNEELYTINAEHQKTIETISDLNNDLDSLLKHTHLGILFLDSRLNIRRFNAFIKNEINVTDTDIGRPIAHFSSHLNYSSMEEDIRTVLKEGKVLEREITSASGKWYVIRITPYEVGDGNLQGVVCTLIDISSMRGVERLQELSQKNIDLERAVKNLEMQNKAYKKRLQRKEEELQNFVDLFPMTYFKFDHQGKIESHHVSQLFPRPNTEEHQNKPFSLAKLLDQNVREELVKGLEEADHYQRDDMVRIPFHKQTEASNLHQEIRISAKDVDGNIVGIFDQTELWNLRQALHRAENLQKLVAQHIPDGSMMVFDRELRCLFTEGEFLWKTQKGNRIDSPVEAERPVLENACRAALKGKTKQVEFIREQDTYVASFIPVVSDEKEIYAGLIIGQKITDMKKVQRDLQARLRDMEQFAYSVSHDLKSPLRSIASFTQLLQRRYGEYFDETAQEYFEFISTNTKSMTELIQGLLNYARLGSEEQPLQVVHINATVKEVVGKLDALIKEQNAEIIIDDLPSVMGFPAHMIQLFQNLIENGLKFNESKVKKIHISGNAQGKWALFSIQDNGIGIEEHYHEQIFEVFKHLNTRDKYEGSGLGLSQCKRIVERMNGRIWLNSKLGEGTTFSFTLPIVNDK